MLPSIRRWINVVRDNLAVMRPDYYLVVGPNELCFFSAGHHGQVDILAQLEIVSLDRGIQDILIRLRQGGHYFGQEITVLLAEPATYTVLRGTASVTMEQLRAECRLLASDSNARQEVRVLSIYGSEYYVIFGIDGEFADKTMGRLKEAGVTVRQVFTLSGLILGGTTFAQGKQPFMGRITSIGGLQCLLGFHDQERLSYYESGAYSNPIDWTKAITQLFGLGGDKESGPLVDEQTRALNGIQNIPCRLDTGFSRRSSQLRVCGEAVVGKTRHLLTAAGSARLSFSVSVAILVVVLLVGGVFSVLARGGRQAFSGYQERLSDIAVMEQELRVLERKLAATSGHFDNSGQFSAEISLFCQKTPANLYLTGLKTESTADSGMQTVAQGVAKNEAAVFQYRDYLNDIDSIATFEIISIARSGNAGAADSSLYKFTISVRP